MNTMLTIAYYCHFTCGVLFALMGLVYLRRRRFMPYHGVALGTAWEKMEDAQRTLILASMRIIGSAWLAIAMALVILLWNGFRSGQRWAIYGVPLIGLAVSLPTLLAILQVKSNTHASPPWQILALLALLFSIGLLLSIAA